MLSYTLVGGLTLGLLKTTEDLPHLALGILGSELFALIKRHCSPTPLNRYHIVADKRRSLESRRAVVPQMVSNEKAS